MEDLHLIVGLGNPGGDYARTRHNAGFLVVDKLGTDWRARWGHESRFNARVARGKCAGRPVLLCQPQTYMNSSGEAVGSVLTYFRVETSRLLVVVDDADLPLGEIRLRPSGSSAGHHGLESIEQHLGTRDYARLRVGIGRHSGAREITNYVLGRFSSTDEELLNKVLTVASRQAETWVEAGIQKAMSQFNGVLPGLDSENERKDQ